MTNVTIKDLFRKTSEYTGKEVTIEGWTKTIRDSKTFGFIELNDGSFFKNVQIVFNNIYSHIFILSIFVYFCLFLYIF